MVRRNEERKRGSDKEETGWRKEKGRKDVRGVRRNEEGKRESDRE